MHFFCKGSGRFTRLWEAARDGEAAAPVDLRYLKRPNSRVMTDDAASTRGDIFSFLQYVYESQAETLPDFRDELKEELGAVTTIDLSTEDPYVVEMQHETKQTLRAVLPDPGQRKPRKKKHAVEINLERTSAQFEERCLPLHR